MVAERLEIRPSGRSHCPCAALNALGHRLRVAGVRLPEVRRLAG